MKQYWKLIGIRFNCMMKKEMSVLLCAVLLLSGCALAYRKQSSSSESGTSFEKETILSMGTGTRMDDISLPDQTDISGTDIFYETTGTLPDSTSPEESTGLVSDSDTRTESSTVYADTSGQQETTETKAPETSAFEVPQTPEELLETMSVEELVGQIFLARHPGSEKDALDDIDKYKLGGYILFGRDFKNMTPETVKKRLSRYNGKSSVPMLFAVDEEGGTVVRVSSVSAFRKTKFPSPRDIFNTSGMEGIREVEREKAALLHSIGINVNMAPVCDITTDPDYFMYKRSLGQSPEITGEFVKTAIEASRDNNVCAVLKHFPGYGNNVDTHTDIAVDSRSLEELEERDLIPFQTGISFGAGAVLVSHNIVTCIDSVYPATLSPAVHEYLRNKMGFDGVIVTDDLSMGAIIKVYGKEEAAVLAVLAGNDLLCSTDYRIQYAAVLEAVKSGRIPEATLKQSVLRILELKRVSLD